jgi:predicted transcriptional regulator
MPSLLGLGTKALYPLTTSYCYRDRIYIIKDIILKLVEYGYLNQTSLISFCNLNLKKHRSILDELEFNALISRSESSVGHRTMIIYKPTLKGIEFCNRIIEPYEEMFPRQKKQETKVDLNDKVTKEVGAVEELNSNTNSITN